MRIHAHALAHYIILRVEINEHASTHTVTRERDACHTQVLVKLPMSCTVSIIIQCIYVSVGNWYCLTNSKCGCNFWHRNDYNNYICDLSFITRNGVVRHESVMRLRNKLEELGKMKRVNQDEKGEALVMIFNV